MLGGESDSAGGAGRGSPVVGGGMLTRLRSWDIDIDDATERVEGPGLGGAELSVLSESSDDMVNRLLLDLDWVDLDLRIWLCRRLRGGVGGRLFCDWVRWRESVEADACWLSDGIRM